jgi:hypothetical protein
MLEIDPPKLVCAEPCGLPSIVRNDRYWLPSPSVFASLRNPGGAEFVLKKGRRLIPWTPSVTQNRNGLFALNWTVPSGSDAPRKSRVKIFGAG